MATDEERIALFIDHENLVIGAREIGRAFDIGPVMEALAERGRVVARRAYADWTLFADDRRSLVEHNCELIDIPQRTGAVRKNAADIKLAVDAMELAYERGFVSTFVIASGDSDFTPLVAALRALNRRVIGIGVKGSTSALLPPSCDEFMFYDRLPGVSEPAQRPSRSGNGGRGRPSATPAPQEEAQERERPKARNGGRDLQDVQRAVTQTLAGLKQSGTEPVLASTLKRAMLRKDPTFSESDYGFRAFGELLRQLERNGVISLAVGQAPGDPAVDFADPGADHRQGDLRPVQAPQPGGGAAVVTPQRHACPPAPAPARVPQHLDLSLQQPGAAGLGADRDRQPARLPPPRQRQQPRQHRQAAAPPGEQGRPLAVLRHREPPTGQWRKPDVRGDRERWPGLREQRPIDQRSAEHHREQDREQAGGLRQLRPQRYRPRRQHPGSCGTSTRPTLWRKASTTCGPANWKVWR